ncbi:(d)CMP kinase [Candidatus Frankia alpina]|uniref:(d)CMP kinase n=1 Tax=Candidatus Frankia alpina TaxID=2699483 RepID=UPI0013D3D491|nr:(d)CMP kinase [Candidatus Frankia alpina]
MKPDHGSALSEGGSTADGADGVNGTSAPLGSKGGAPTLADGPAEPMIVAVDGPGGSGKSTVARELARRLGLRYLDTGAMYRAVTQLALERRIDIEDPQAVAELAERAVLTIGTDPDRPSIAVDGVSVDAEIRTRAVTNAVSAIAAVPAVRALLVAQQRQVIAATRPDGIVVEGRDIGSVVAPDAQIKVFLTASTEVRALRRSRQLGEKGVDDVARTLAELDRRDALDSSRAADPLAIPEGAIVLDSTALSVPEVVDEVLRRCGQSSNVAT